MAAVFGALSSVSTSAGVALTSTSSPLSYGIWVKAGTANTSKVYVGLSTSITAGTTDATDGYELSAGQEVFLPVYVVTNATAVYVIAAASSQKVYFFGH